MWAAGASRARGSRKKWPGSLRLELLHCATLVAGAALTRYPCRSHYLYDVDSVNFALALDHFDPALYQPHPPGYFLYIWSARLLNFLFHDANASLVALSLLASCVTAILIYLLTREWFGARAGLFAGAMFVLSPLCWFHGTVALTYAVEACFSALVGLLCWRAQAEPVRLHWAAAVTLGIAAGFRPSSLLFLTPLWLFSQRKSTGWVKTLGLLLLSLTLVAWCIPMVQATGGLRPYLAALFGLWSLVPGKESVVSASPFIALARLFTILGIGALCFGCAAVLWFRPSGVADPLLGRKKAFTWVWVAPGLLFFSLVFLRFVNSGYLLVLSPAVFAWLGSRASAWYSDYQGRRLIRNALIGLAALANMSLFLFAPLYCSLRSVRQFETELSRTVDGMRGRFRPGETLIVGFDSHFLGYRHAAYYLPEFLTVQYPAVTLAGGTKIFAVRNRMTKLLAEVPTAQFHRFVLFPLPAGKDYQEYAERQEARFPAGSLRSEGASPTFVTGRASDLPYLFSPDAGRRSTVYTKHHKDAASCIQGVTPGRADRVYAAPKTRRSS